MSHVTSSNCASYLVLLCRRRWHVAFVTACRRWRRRWNSLITTCRRRVKHCWHIRNILCLLTLAICRIWCRYERRHICNTGRGLLSLLFLLPAAAVICHHLFMGKDERGRQAYITHRFRLYLIIGGSLTPLCCYGPVLVNPGPPCRRPPLYKSLLRRPW